MTLWVMKFGGTSVASLDCMEIVADRILEAKSQGIAVVVVLSAMAGETERLIGLAKQVTPYPNPLDYSMLVSTGEQVSVALLSMILAKREVAAKPMMGWQAGVHTRGGYKNARIVSLQLYAVEAALCEGVVPVITGFQGVSEDGAISTLGRGGSDTSAVALAVGLKADECRIYTDVDGVYTADPRIVPKAQRMMTVTFEEMLELASLGAKVLQIRSVEFAGRFNMPLRVLSTFKSGEGTLITYEQEGLERPLVTGIAYNRSEAQLTFEGIADGPGIAAQIIAAVSAVDIGIDLIVKNMSRDGITDFTFTVHRDDLSKALSALSPLKEILQAKNLYSDPHIAKVSLVGVGMRSHAGIANTLLDCLAKEGINIQLIATSEIKISVVIDEKYLELALRAIHTAFGLDEPATEEMDPKVP